MASVNVDMTVTFDKGNRRLIWNYGDKVVERYINNEHPEDRPEWRYIGQLRNMEWYEAAPHPTLDDVQRFATMALDEDEHWI